MTLDPTRISPSLSPDNFTTTREIVIPLVHDGEFFKILSNTLEGISSHMKSLQSNFEQSLKALAATIGDTSHPASVAADFHPHSRLTENAGAVRVKRTQLKVKTILKTFRRILNLMARTTYMPGERYFSYTSKQKYSRA